MTGEKVELKLYFSMNVFRLLENGFSYLLISLLF